MKKPLTLADQRLLAFLVVMGRVTRITTKKP